MKSRFKTTALKLASLALLAPMATLAADHGDFHITQAQQIDWQDGPASLPPGAQMAVLAGDPNKKGPFVVRFQMPAHYTVAMHTHPMVENLTVISGQAQHQRKIDDAPQTVTAGDFIHLPKNMAHKVWTTDQPVVMQLAAIGPFKIHYLNAADDPRKKVDH